ncbi:MAG: surface-adhesin E family protein [Pseudomonadota bacterium]
MVVWLACVQAPVQASTPTSTQAKWFTVAGNPTDAAADTVQVDPVALGVDGPLKTMNLRVNRSTLRTNWEGVPYRSYESEVAFDCRARRADYRIVTYYMAPTWQGAPHLTTNYANDPKPMLFRDMAPNPTSRIIRAACRSRNG